MSEDAELLRLYAETGAQEAFTQLVQRYLPLVHSAALRQSGGNPHQAQDVAQAVFTILARKAGALQRHPALAGWLYTTTYHAAAKIRRADQRRHHREQEASAMHHENDDGTGSPDWNELGPVLDELMLQLSEEDRTAVLLRYFENRSHAEVGRRIGLSENAARMRVDRALASLRSVLSRRGIVSSAAALGATLSSQAVIAPPAGVAASVALAATTAPGGLGLFLLMKSTAVKTAALVVVLGSGAAGLVWQQRENARLESENRDLRARLASPPTPRASTPPAKSADTTDAPSLRAEIDHLRQSPANSWQERARQLRELVAGLPDVGIPELQLATEEDWLEAAKEPLETVDDYRRALASLRTKAIMRFATDAEKALGQYLEKNRNQFPTNPAQLEPYLERSIGAGVWDRYEVQPAGSVPNMIMGGDWIITQKAPVDAEYDAKFVIGPYGYGSTPYEGLAIQQTLAPVIKAYADANGGKRWNDLNALLPYATTAEQRAAIEKQKRSRTAK